MGIILFANQAIANMALNQDPNVFW